MSATASPLISIFNSYNASVAKGSAVVGFGGLTLEDGCTSMIRIDLPAPPGFGNANRSVKSSRASPWGKLKLGPEKWCDMDQSSSEKPSGNNPVNRRPFPPRGCQRRAKEFLNQPRKHPS